MKYSKTKIKTAKETDSDYVYYEPKTNEFIFNYVIRVNKKTKRFMCNCPQAKFCEVKNMYCNHILTMLRKYDEKAFNKEIENE